MNARKVVDGRLPLTAGESFPIIGAIRMHRRSWALALLVTAWPAVAAAQVHKGGEFQVNAYTTSNQTDPQVATDAGGGFVVVWDSYGQDGDKAGVFGRRYDAAGNALTGEFQVNTYTTGQQKYATVAADASGNFIVVWNTREDGVYEDVFARRYDPAGNPLGGELRVNVATIGNQANAHAAFGGDGSLVVVWQDDYLSRVVARRYDVFGVPGPEFNVTAFTTGPEFLPAVAADAAGNFVVVWAGLNEDSSGVGIAAQRFDSTGTRVGGQFVVNSYSTGDQSLPAIAMAPSGEFMVAWESDQDGDGKAIVARRFSAAGVPLSGDLVVNTYTTNVQERPSVAADSQGDFVVTWNSLGGEYGPGLGGFGVFARRYDSSGTPDPPFLVNTYTTQTQQRAAVAAAPNGDFVVAWQSMYQDGDSNGVFAQRFSPDLIFRDGFEKESLAAWSAAATDGGDLGTSSFAALHGSSFGLQGVVNDTHSLYVEDDSPRDENRYRARFYLDAHDFDPGEGQGHFRTRVFLVFEEAPTRRLAAIVLKRQGGAGAYSIEGRCRLNDNRQADTGFFAIGAGPHWVEIDWQRATTPIAADGRFELFIDGTSRAVLTGLANGASAVDFVRLGALSVKTGANGTLYWDEFESRRQGYVGP